jgi:hypothetical protein
MAITMYSPQRINTKPALPRGMGEADPKKQLIEALKTLSGKQNKQLLNQSPAAVMGAMTNPPDVSPGVGGLTVGDVGMRARMMGGM